MISQYPPPFATTYDKPMSSTQINKCGVCKHSKYVGQCSPLDRIKIECVNNLVFGTENNNNIIQINNNYSDDNEHLNTNKIHSVFDDDKMNSLMYESCCT